MKFYFDECLSYYLVDALNSIVRPTHYDIVHTKRDMGWGRLPDTVWIKKLPANEESFIVTRDPHQRTRAAERLAWKQANAVMFFLPGPWIHAIGPEQAWRLIRWWAEIERTAKYSAKGLAYRIPFRARPSRLIPWKE